MSWMRLAEARAARRVPEDRMVIEPATSGDLPEVRTLLERHHLPIDGVDELAQTMIVARNDTHVVGAAALELYADGALLRSVVVDAAMQGKRVGHRLTEAALEMAHQHGARTVFLMTTTADRFFPKFGFERITRDDVPASVQASIEFRSACPASAIVMRKRLATTMVRGEISIRAAETTEAQAIARLLGQLGYDATPADIASRLARILTRRDHRFVIAEAEGQVVGWIHASVSEHIDSAACVLIEGLVVDREHRGRGIGRVLLDDAEAWARAIGCSLVRLRSTDARTEAHQFYQHLGYTKVKTQHSFAKAVDSGGERSIARLVPRVEH
jgi:amino-acid N-acetyltransferase